MNFESSLILGSFFFTVSVKLLLKDYLEELGVICLFLQILYLGWYLLACMAISLTCMPISLASEIVWW
jgi:hypothetical protein